jgi:hypothetical protein
MKSSAICATLIVGFGALVFMGTVASTIPASAKCMIDEGNGRRTPCEAMYTKKHVAKTSRASKPVPQSTATRTGPSTAPGTSAPGTGGRSDRNGGRAASF